MAIGSIKIYFVSLAHEHDQLKNKNKHSKNI